jgi:glucose-6-phosphate isomerase
MIHQGTEIVPSEFIGFSEPLHPIGEHHDMLIANMFAQAEALAFGRSAKELEEAGSPPEQVPHRVCEGGRPSTTILVDGPLTPRALGSLVALYEHRVLTEGVCWGIDSFDQWGVELGKVLATKLISELTSEQAPPPDHDASTVALVHRYRELRGRAT